MKPGLGRTLFPDDRPAGTHDPPPTRIQGLPRLPPADSISPPPSLLSAVHPTQFSKSNQQQQCRQILACPCSVSPGSRHPGALQIRRCGINCQPSSHFHGHQLREADGNTSLTCFRRTSPLNPAGEKQSLECCHALRSSAQRTTDHGPRTTNHGPRTTDHQHATPPPTAVMASPSGLVPAASAAADRRR